MPVSELASAIPNSLPIQVAKFYGLDHASNKRVLMALIKDLEVANDRFEIILDGETVTREYLRNVLRRWHEISYDTEMENDLESGEPGEEALRWGTGTFEYPPEDD
jgi:hypothetical protein